jgi:endonuclease YncB( thermonuclease family)
MLKASKRALRILFSLVVATALAVCLIPTGLIAADPIRTIRTVEGTVTKISDGDTIQVVTPGQTKIKVRLYGIDAPETSKPQKPGQPYGNESWNALEKKVRGKHVKVDIVDIDKYRRMVSIVWVGDRNINLEMVREGYAEAYPEYLKPPYRSSFLAAEKDAKAAKRGIWGLERHERPQDFRRRIRH